jgi:hypothetical protein
LTDGRCPEITSGVAKCKSHCCHQMETLSIEDRKLLEPDTKEDEQSVDLADDDEVEIVEVWTQQAVEKAQEVVEVEEVEEVEIG